MESKDWNEFTKDKLLLYNIIDGVLLITPNLQIVYSYGKLNNLQTEELSQFHNIFQLMHNKEKHNLNLQNGFSLTINEESLKFVIRQSQHHSVYAITKSNLVGIVVVNIGYGYLVATHSYPIQSCIAARHVEDVCFLMRS